MAAADQYLCNSKDKLVTNVWSINNILYLTVLHYRNDTNNGIERRIFAYDSRQKKFINVFHFPMESRQYRHQHENDGHHRHHSHQHRQEKPETQSQMLDQHYLKGLLESIHHCKH